MSDRITLPSDRAATTLATVLFLLAGCGQALDHTAGARGAGPSRANSPSPTATASLQARIPTRTEAARPPLPAPAPPAEQASQPAQNASASPGVADEIPAVRTPTSWSSPTENPQQRADEALSSKLDTVRSLFAGAGVKFPPSRMLLRAFKQDRRLELWAASRDTAPLVHVTTYDVCSLSGVLGPKRREGDGQVPEGFYTLSDYVPTSKFYLAMLVSYPNASDMILGDRRKPGSEIMIHGNCFSIGCLAMSDERVQEIWVAATALRYAGGTVHLHIFPSRDMNALLASGEHPEHHAFWKTLLEGLEHFNRTKRIPLVQVDGQGRYQFR